MKCDARPDQLITFTRCLHEARPIKDRDLPPAALNQSSTLQLSGGIRDGWPLDTQHFGEQVLSDRQYVIIVAVTHHEQPTRQPFLEAVRTVARYRHHDLFQKCVDIGVHQTSEGRHRPHGSRKRRTRHLRGAPRDLDEKLDGGNFGTEDGLHASATLPSDRCHLNDTAVRINSQDRDDPTIGEKNMVQRTVSIHQDLLALAANVFKLRHKPLKIAGRQGEQKPIAGPI